jgi:hypothetical protein
VAGLDAGEAREIVEHHQLGVAPCVFQPELALDVTERSGSDLSPRSAIRNCSAGGAEPRSRSRS